MDMHTEIELDASAARAWEILGTHFGDIGDWAVTIRSSVMDGPTDVGATRTCEVGGFGPVPSGRVRETLVRFDPEARAFTYEAIEGLPAFMTHAVNRWTIEDRGDRCVVRSHGTLELVWWMRPLAPLLRWQLRRNLAGFVDELRHVVEEGTPHPRKAEANRRLAAA